MFDGNASVTVSHGFLLSRRFHHENIILLRVTFQIVHSCWPLTKGQIALLVALESFWLEVFQRQPSLVVLVLGDLLQEVSHVQQIGFVSSHLR